MRNKSSVMPVKRKQIALKRNNDVSKNDNGVRLLLSVTILRAFYPQSCYVNPLM
jgi:hypothetical protein